MGQPPGQGRPHSSKRGAMVGGVSISYGTVSIVTQLCPLLREFGSCWRKMGTYHGAFFAHEECNTPLEAGWSAAWHSPKGGHSSSSNSMSTQSPPTHMPCLPQHHKPEMQLQLLHR